MPIRNVYIRLDSRESKRYIFLERVYIFFFSFCATYIIRRRQHDPINVRFLNTIIVFCTNMYGGIENVNIPFCWNGFVRIRSRKMIVDTYFITRIWRLFVSRSSVYLGLVGKTRFLWNTTARQGTPKRAARNVDGNSIISLVVHARIERMFVKDSLFFGSFNYVKTLLMDFH